MRPSLASVQDAAIGLVFARDVKCSLLMLLGPTAIQACAEVHERSVGTKSDLSWRLDMEFERDYSDSCEGITLPRRS